jgi:hypothetical protein
MLSTRGIPVHAVWLNKLVLWGLAAVVASAATIGACLLTDAFIDRGTSPPHLELPEQNFSNDGEYPSLAEVGFRFAWWCGLTTVAVFVLAFTTSQLFPKAVLVVGVTMIGSIGLVMWLAYSLQFGLLTLAMSPVIVWLLLVGERSLSWWWAEHVTWRLPWRRWLELATLSLFPLLLLPALGYYRAWAVPTPSARQVASHDDLVHAPPHSPSLHASAIHEWGRVSGLHQALPMLPGEQTVNRLLAERRLVSAVEDLENVPSEDELAMWEAMGGITPMTEAPGRDGAGPGDMEPSDPAPVFPMDAIAPIDRLKSWEVQRGIAIDGYAQLVELAEVLSHLHVVPPETKRFLQEPHDVRPLLYAAILALEGDRPSDESIKLVTGALKLAVVHRQFAALEPRTPWMIEPAQVERLLLRWAEHPKMTEGKLLRVLSDARWVEPFSWMSLERLDAQRAWEISTLDSALLPWDRARAARIRAVARYNRWMVLDRAQLYALMKNAPTLWWQNASAEVPFPFTRRVQVVGFSWVEPDQAIGFRLHPTDRIPQRSAVVGVDQVFMSELMEPVWGFRVLLLKMAVHGWWRIHGVAPASLADLQPWFAHHPAGLFDPWTSNPFGYAPRATPDEVGLADDPTKDALPRLKLWHTPSRLTDQLGQAWDGGPREPSRRRADSTTPYQGASVILRMPLPPEME